MLPLSVYKPLKFWLLVSIISLAVAACTPVTNQELDRLSEELSASKILVSELQIELSTAQLQTKHLTTSDQDLNLELTNRDATILELKSNLKSRIDTLDENQEMNSGLAMNVSQALNTIDGLTEELTTAVDSYTNLEEQLMEAQQNKDKYLNKNLELAAEIDKLIEQLTELEKSYSRDAHRMGTQLDVTEANLQYTLKQVNDIKVLLLMWERVFTIDEAANIIDIDNMDILTMSVLQSTKVGHGNGFDWDSYTDSINDDTVRHKYETYVTDE